MGRITAKWRSLLESGYAEPGQGVEPVTPEPEFGKPAPRGPSDTDVPGEANRLERTPEHRLRSLPSWNRVAEVHLDTRYSALGIPLPDPETVCKGPCEGMGFYPVKGERRGLSTDAEDAADVVLSDADELTDYDREAWEKAEAESPSDDGYHFIVCPDCNGTGLNTVPGKAAVDSNPGMPAALAAEAGDRIRQRLSGDRVEEALEFRRWFRSEYGPVFERKFFGIDLVPEKGVDVPVFGRDADPDYDDEAVVKPGYDPHVVHKREATAERPAQALVTDEIPSLIDGSVPENDVTAEPDEPPMASKYDDGECGCGCGAGDDEEEGMGGRKVLGEPQPAVFDYIVGQIRGPLP